MFQIWKKYFIKESKIPLVSNIWEKMAQNSDFLKNFFFIYETYFSYATR